MIEVLSSFGRVDHRLFEIKRIDVFANGLNSAFAYIKDPPPVPSWSGSMLGLLVLCMSIVGIMALQRRQVVDED